MGDAPVPVADGIDRVPDVLANVSSVALTGSCGAGDWHPGSVVLSGAARLRSQAVRVRSLLCCAVSLDGAGVVAKFAANAMARSTGSGDAVCGVLVVSVGVRRWSGQSRALTRDARRLLDTARALSAFQSAARWFVPRPLHAG